MTKKSAQEGQVALIVLLLSSVLLTVGVSVASRGVSELRLSRQEEDSTRAFDIAEIGIEEAMRQDLSQISYNSEGKISESFDTGDPNIEASYTVEEIKEWKMKLENGETGEVNVRGNIAGRLFIEWPQGTSCSDEGAIMVTKYRVEGGNYNVERTAFASPGCIAEQGGAGGPQFVEAWPVASGTMWRRPLIIDPEDEIVRIKPIFSGTTVTARPDSTLDLPAQFYKVTSQATNTVGNETRAIEVRRSVLAAPSLFDYALFSGTAIIK